MDKWEQLKAKLKQKKPEVAQKGLFQKKYAYQEVLEMMAEIEEEDNAILRD